MSRTPPSARSKPDPVSVADELDDLLAAPALKPSLRFLGLEEKEAAPPAPAVTAPPVAPPSPAIAPLAAVTPAPAITAAQKAGAPLGHGAPGAAVTPPLDVAPGAAAPDVIAGHAETSPPAVKRKRIHRCTGVHDGHSHIEHAVYQILWDNSSVEPDGSRVCRLGLPKIAQQAYVHERNIGIIIRRLVQKQSIEILRKEVSDLRTARTYRVLDGPEILERRRRAGLEWVLRGRGVEFVDPQSGRPLFQDEDLIFRQVSTGDAVTPPTAPGVTAVDPPV